MESLLARLAGAASRRHVLVIGLWVCLLAGASWFSLHQSDRLSGGGWEVQGSQSVRVSDLLDRFPTYPGSGIVVLVAGDSTTAVANRVARAEVVGRGRRDLRVGDPRTFAGSRAVLLPFTYVGPTTAAIDTASAMRRALVQTRPELVTRVIGEAAIWSNYAEVSKHQLRHGEELGFPLILMILIAAFGTLVAAAAPIILGAVAVFLAGAAIYLISAGIVMSIYVTNMASMIGIGVAVDYSLFVVSRFRTELARTGSKETALQRAFATSGTAVVFSGATVAISLAGLFVINVNAIRSMAVGAIVVVSIAVAGTITLLPALLGRVGRNIERLRIGLPWDTSEAGSPFWSTWSRRVMARPVMSLLLGTAAMLLLAAPLPWIVTYNRGLDQLPKGAEVRVATEAAARLAGPGFAGPVHIVTGTRAAAELARARVGALPGVARTSPVIASADGHSFLTDAVLRFDPESARARKTLGQIRGVAGGIAAAQGTEALVGGATAFGLDVENAVFGGLWRMLLFILAASYVVLLVLLRSVVLPLKAVAMNLLSVGAAYGVLVSVFQLGWLGWAGFRGSGYVDTIVPALVMAVTFGLSMDYEVFLLTRIRERYLVHGDNERAVAEGLTASGRIITSAALVMVAVFGAFAVAGAGALRELGVGLAVAIVLDATIVRLVIVPSAMRLLGEWNWWLPTGLARVLHARPQPVR
jgi:RND superfamily putative drug exporter